MVITDYVFYTGAYFGDIIPEDSFPKYERLAEDELHLITGGKLKGLRSYPEEVKRAVCALAEIVFQVDEEKRNTGTGAANHGKIVKTVSSGNESISYDVQKSEFSEAAVSRKLRNRLFQEAVTRYLSGTGLLYAGLE